MFSDKVKRRFLLGGAGVSAIFAAMMLRYDALYDDRMEELRTYYKQNAETECRQLFEENRQELKEQGYGSKVLFASFCAREIQEKYENAEKSPLKTEANTMTGIALLLYLLSMGHREKTEFESRAENNKDGEDYIFYA